MGNKESSKKGNSSAPAELTEQEIETLLANTNFSAQQLHDWHQSFIRDCPSGKLDKKRFIQVYRQFYTQGKADRFCELAFNAFDHDKDGVVDFREFLTAITMTTSSELENRLDLAFTMYDINRDGSIDKKELTQILEAIYELTGRNTLDKDNMPAKKAAAIIDKFDINHDKQLTRQEFISGCLKYPDLRKLLIP